MSDATTDHTLVDVQPYARYRFDGKVIDRLPYLTYLIGADHEPPGLPTTVMRVCNARKGSKTAEKAPSYVTEGGRVLFHFWSRKTTEGESIARRRLAQAKNNHTWRWIVKPGDPEYELLDAFKVLCDHRRDKPVPTTLLYRALGLDLTP